MCVEYVMVMLAGWHKPLYQFKLLTLTTD